MARKVLIQIMYGLEMNIGSLNIGELGYCTDTQKLYIGTPAGNILLVAAETAGDMLKSIYDTNNDGVVDVADTVPWSGVSGKKEFPASIESQASLTVPHGVAPTAPVNGDIWSTTSGIYIRINGANRTLVHTGTWSTVSQAEAEAGTATTTRLWTAQRVAQAIAKQANLNGPLTWGGLKGE